MPNVVVPAELNEIGPDGVFVRGLGFRRVADAAAVALSRTVAGLLARDDFERADESPVQTPWSIFDADGGGEEWRIETRDGTKALLQRGSNGGNSFAIHEDVDAEAPLAETFTQVYVRSTDWPAPGVVSHFSGTDGGSDWDGYYYFRRDFENDHHLERADAGTLTNIADVDTADILRDTWNPIQFYCAAGVQEGWLEEHDSLASAADATHADGRCGLLARTATTGEETQFNDYICCRSKNIVVTGLESGWKAKVLDSGDAVVAEATESGGTATVDCSRNGGATEIIPYDGWAALIITDGADAEQHRFDSEAVYPGDEYELA